MSVKETARVDPNGFAGREGFDPSQHPRNTDGKFATKTGAAAEVSLSETYPVGFPVNGTNDTRAIAQILADKLRAGDNSLELSDIGDLRRALEEAEYRAVANDADRFLREVYPDARAMVVSFDAFSGDPYIVGVETSDPEPGSGRNYGDIRPLDDGFDEVNGFNTEYSHYLQRFENEGLFDEYGTVLIDDNSDYGEFVDPSDPNENSLGLQDSARVYRLGGRG